jgi:hypothetical protein
MPVCSHDSPPLEQVAPGHRVACHAVAMGKA